MKRTTKQWLSAFLAIVMLLGLLVVPAAAAPGDVHEFDATKLTEDGATAGGDATESAGASESTGTEATASPSTEATASPSTEASPSTGTEETTPTAPIDERIWGVPADIDLSALEEGGQVVADFHGVSLSVPPSNWEEKMANDGFASDASKAWGLVNKGLMSGNQAASDAANVSGSKVKPETADAGATFEIKAGTAFIFTVGDSVPDGTQVAIFSRHGEKYAWLLEGNQLMTLESEYFNTKTQVAVDAKPMYFPVEKGKTYTYFISGGNTILYGFAVIGPNEEKLKEPTVTKPEEPDPTPARENEWVADETSLGEIKKFNNNSLAFDQETLIPSDVTKVTGVQFYLGGSGKKGASNTYKLVSAEGSYDAALNAGNDAISDLEKESGLSLDNPIPVAGTYYKWVAEGYGALEIKCIINGAKSVYFTKNGDGIDGFFDVQLKDKTQTILTIPVAAGDIVYLAMQGSKPMLVSYRLIKTDTALEEVEVPWSADESGIGTPTTTVTPNKDKLSVTVKGPRTGSEVAPPQLKLYADTVTVSLYDAKDKLVDVVEFATPGTERTATFMPPVTGTYTVKVTASRSSADKDLVLYNGSIDFDKPLESPKLIIQVLDGGNLRPTWSALGGAEKIEVLLNDKVVQTIDLPDAATKTAGNTLSSKDGLVVGTPAKITVRAHKGAEVLETTKTETPSATAEYTWKDLFYGISVTDKKDYKKEGTGLNEGESGSVTLVAENDGGKFLDSGQADGLMIYYTSIPADLNFTFRAKVHVDTWAYGGGQEAMGIMVMDSVPETNLTEEKFFTNEIFVGGMRLSYWWDFANGVLGNAGSPATYDKVNERLGVATRRKLGLTPDNILDANNNEPEVLNMWCPEDTVAGGGSSTPLLTDAITKGGSYNLIGNLTKEGQTALEKANYQHLAANAVTDLDLTITRNNTGYKVTYTDSQGKEHPWQTYGTYDAMNKLNDENIYLGFFVSRNATITVDKQNISLTTRPASDDPDAETKPPETVYPAVSIDSAESSNKAEYDLVLNANVSGTADITFNGVKQEPLTIESAGLTSKTFTLGTDEDGVKDGVNIFDVYFTPDAHQFDGSADYELASAETIHVTWDTAKNQEKLFKVNYHDRWAKMDYLYVGPNGGPNGRGIRSSPIDLKTAIESARPGQTIVVMAGASQPDYSPIFNTYTIPKSSSGTAEEPICMIADPEAEHRPVLDFNNAGGGLRLAADYWEINGLDFIRSTGAGLQVSGNNNKIINVKAYNNSKAGIALERLSATAEKIEDWPSDNLIKNCEAYNNADGSHQDADGFTAKLTCGRGNVFDGCVAHHNADDGWDMFAKASVIGDVTVKNCLAYKNGYLFDSDGNEFQSEGNGNGFKLGGNDMPGKHTLINSYAYYNAAKGIDSNSGSNCVVQNCTSFNNGIGTKSSKKDVNGYNYAMYTGASSSAFVLEGLVSLKDEAAFKDYAGGADDRNFNNAKDNLVPKGKQKSASLRSNDNYFWNEIKGASLNKASDTITAADFVSLDPTLVTIGEDGSISMNGFLELKQDLGTGAGSMEATVFPRPTVGEETGEVPAPVASASSSGGGRRDEDRGTTSGDQSGETTTPETTSPVIDTTASKATDMDGNTEIVVKDKDGNTVADVKIPATVPAPETSFVDVPAGHWAEDSINALAGMGLVNGVGNARYDMTSPVTRGAIATILYRLADGSNAKENTFTDVTSGQWYTDAVAWAATVGVVTGYTDGTFGPNNTITRQELAVMIVRLAKLIGMKTDADAAALDSFVDASSVGSWATSDLAWCVANGIVNGKGANNLDPAASVTRTEAATMINRFIDLVK